jgi:hypothetical protein
MDEKRARDFIQYIVCSNFGVDPPKEDDKSFCDFCLYWFGGRSLNRYMCYDSLAIDLARYVRRLSFSTNYGALMEGVSKLLWDDRHDLYQNLPYHIEDFLKESPELEDEFYAMLKKAILKALDPHGNYGGDTEHG